MGDIRFLHSHARHSTQSSLKGNFNLLKTLAILAPEGRGA